MANSNQTSAARKPHPDYPLTARGEGRWCKKIRGRVHYFTGAAQEALEEWLRAAESAGCCR